MGRFSVFIFSAYRARELSTGGGARTSRKVGACGARAAHVHPPPLASTQRQDDGANVILALGVVGGHDELLGSSLGRARRRAERSANDVARLLVTEHVPHAVGGQYEELLGICVRVKVWVWVWVWVRVRVRVRWLPSSRRRS